MAGGVQTLPSSPAGGCRRAVALACFSTRLAGAGLVLGIGLAGGLAAAPAMAGDARAGEVRTYPACVEVANDTAYWMPGSLWVPGGAPVGVKFDANQTTRACLDRWLPRDVAIEVVVKSGWGMPIAACHLPPGGRMRIERRPDNDGKVETRLICF